MGQNPRLDNLGNAELVKYLISAPLKFDEIWKIDHIERTF